MKAEIHWNKQLKRWTIHTYKGCEWADHIVVKGPWRTEVKPTRKTNPKGWVVAKRSQVQVVKEATPLSTQLIYDKQNMVFNASTGDGIVFTPSGAFYN